MEPELKRVIRLDSLPLTEAGYTPEGYLIDRPVLTSTGIFEYVNPDGTVRRELRLPEEVFSPESLASYRGRPIIITHSAGVVNKDNVARYQIGTIMSEGFRDGDNVRAEIVIHDTDAMKRCGFRELSLGYNLDLEETPGIWNGLRYDAVQRNIRINHLALVREARAGDQARLNIDSRDSILTGGRKMNDRDRKNAVRTDGLLDAEALARVIQDFMANSAGTETQLDAEAAPAAAAAPEEKPGAGTAAAGPEKPEEQQATAADADEPAPAAPAAAPAAEPDRDVALPQTIEEQLGALKERNPNPDDDMLILLSIIDRLLADREYDRAAGETAGDAAPEETAAAAPEQTPAPAAAEEKKPDDAAAAGRADAADALYIQRVKIGRAAQMLNLDGVEYMPLMDAKKAVIKAVTPSIRLDGKSEVYIDALFDRAFADAEAQSRRDVSFQIRQMFNRDAKQAAPEAGMSAMERRQAMIERRMNSKKEEN